MFTLAECFTIPNFEYDSTWLKFLIFFPSVLLLFAFTLMQLRLESCNRFNQRWGMMKLLSCSRSPLLTPSADLTGSHSLAALPRERFIWQVIVVGFGKARPKECWKLNWCSNKGASDRSSYLGWAGAPVDESSPSWGVTTADEALVCFC